MMKWELIAAIAVAIYTTAGLMVTFLIWRGARSDHRRIKDRLGEKAYAEGMARIKRGEIRIGFDLRLWLLDRFYDCRYSGAILFSRGLALARRVKSILAPDRKGSVNTKGESGCSIDRP